MLKASKNHAGFTLAELLIAASITSLVVGTAGWGLVNIMKLNNRNEAENLRRIELNRALDYIADDIRMANSVIGSNGTAPTWAWTGKLGGGSPVAELYLQIPLSIQSMTASNDLINISNHEFSNGNAVMFTGNGTLAGGLTKNKTYYVVETTNSGNAFKVSSALGGSAINLTSDGSGSLQANRLLTYYIRKNTPTWSPPRTINRSAGPCSNPYGDSNCPALVDSIAAGGLRASVVDSRQAELHLTGDLLKRETYEVSTKVFARAQPPE